MGHQPLVLLLAPQAVAIAGAQAPRSTLALPGRGAGDAPGGQPGDAGGGIEDRLAHQAAVHHHLYALYREAGLRDIGGQYHLAPAFRRRLDGLLLLFQAEAAIQGRNSHVAAVGSLQRRRQFTRHLDNFPLPGQENQHAATVFHQGVLYRLHRHRRNGIAQLVGLAIASVHRVLPSPGSENRGVPQQSGHRLAVQGGRHHQQLQRRPLAEQFTTLQAQCQAQLRIEIAFVKLVEYDQGDILQAGVALQLPGENALGDDLYAGARTDAAVEPDAIADGLAHALSQHMRHTAGCRPGGHAARLQDQDLAFAQPGFPQQRQRHHSGLAGAGRSLHHQFVALAQAQRQLLKYFVDGQVL